MTDPTLGQALARLEALDRPVLRDNENAQTRDAAARRAVERFFEDARQHIAYAISQDRRPAPFPLGRTRDGSREAANALRGYHWSLRLGPGKEGLPHVVVRVVPGRGRFRPRAGAGACGRRHLEKQAHPGTGGYLREPPRPDKQDGAARCAHERIRRCAGTRARRLRPCRKAHSSRCAGRLR
jgi:hypothetical protein